VLDVLNAWKKEALPPGEVPAATKMEVQEVIYNCTSF
jgi:hypothetical protein